MVCTGGSTCVISKLNLFTGQLNLVVAKYKKGFLSDIIDDILKEDIAKMASRAGNIYHCSILKFIISYFGMSAFLRYNSNRYVYAHTAADNTKLSVWCVAGHVVKLAIPDLTKEYPENMKRLRRLLQLSWDMGHSHHSIDIALLWSQHTRLLNQPHTLNGECL